MGDIADNHLLHTGGELGVAEVSGQASDRIIGLELEVVLRRIVGLGLGSDLELPHGDGVAGVGKEQAVDDEVAVDMIDIGAEEVDVERHGQIAIGELVGEVECIEPEVA